MILRFLKRRIVKIVLALGLVPVMIIVGITLALDSIIKAGIKKVGPLVMKVPLMVDDVDVSVLRGSFVMNGFAMGNPEGFDSPHAVTVGRVEVQARLKSFLTDQIDMPLVEVRRPEVTFELSGTKTNLGQIIARLKELKGSATQKKFRIGRLSIQAPSVRLAGLPAGQALSVTLPDIELTDVAPDGASPEQVALKVLLAVYDQVRAALGDELPAAGLSALQAEAQDLFQKGSEALKQGLGELDEAGREARKKLEDMLR